jgi:cbb3-type cytochrome oxidase maturation protein
MDLVFFLLPLSLALATVAVIAFIWATKSGQFDDLETPAQRVLFDDEDDQNQPPTR